MTALKMARNLSTSLRIFRDEVGDVTATTIQVFLLVSTNHGISSKEVLKTLGISQAAVSRNISLLGAETYRGTDGAGLVTTMESPVDRRVKHLFLTEKGRVLAARMARAMDPSAEVDPKQFKTASDDWQPY